MSTTSTYVPPIKAPTTPTTSASDRDANKSEDSGSGSAPEALPVLHVRAGRLGVSGL
jgi:hypothetical protein